MLTSAAVLTAKKCSFVQFVHCLTFQASPGAWCLYDWSAIANYLPSQPFLTNCFIGVLALVLKPLCECSTIFALSLNISINLYKVQGPLACIWPLSASGGATGGGLLAENVQFYFTPHFPFLYDLLSLYDLSLQHRHIYEIKRLVFRSYFNHVIGVLV